MARKAGDARKARDNDWVTCIHVTKHHGRNFSRGELASSSSKIVFEEIEKNALFERIFLSV